MFLCGLGVNPAITIHYSFINEHSCNTQKFNYKKKRENSENIRMQVSKYSLESEK